MKVYVNRIDGLDDAICALFTSKQTLTREMEEEIREQVYFNIGTKGDLYHIDSAIEGYLKALLKWGKSHITLLKFIDISISVYGLHRAGQDDLDAHAKRMDNRIVRNSTRIKGTNFTSEVSEWYEDKIIPTDTALAMIGMKTPDEIECKGKKYVKTVNGYIREDLKDKNDVKRGLYMLSIPSNFMFRINLAEFCHVYQLRNQYGTANPEVKLAIESAADQICNLLYLITKEYMMEVKN